MSDEKLNGPINEIPSSSSQGSKNGKLDRLFNEIPLVPQYGIVLGYPVGASVGSSKVFKYGKIDGTINGKSLGVECMVYPV